MTSNRGTSWLAFGKSGFAALAQVEDHVRRPVCAECDGEGWYIGHEDACYEQCDCVCSGVQVPCHVCTAPPETYFGF